MTERASWVRHEIHADLMRNGQYMVLERFHPLWKWRVVGRWKTERSARDRIDELVAEMSNQHNGEVVSNVTWFGNMPS